jgi:energy-coupling factor transporter ATP-binding protein EcfA2
MNEQWWTGLSSRDPEQKRVLELPSEGRYFVTGPAGCGKTNLLVLRAKYLAKRGVEHYSVLVFNGPLEKFLTSSTKHGVDPEKVDTFVSWMQKQYWSVIGPPDGLPSSLDERRSFLCDGRRSHSERPRPCQVARHEFRT